MTDPEILVQVSRLGPWHHDVELTPGLRTTHAPLSPTATDQRTPTTYRPEDHIRQVAESVYPDGFGGRSFLDCACNGGGHTLAAARLGAGRCFGFDARRHWIDQADYLRNFAPHEDIAFAEATLADLPGLNLEPFDITLFSGIFYHLPDPVNGLKIAADLTGELLILNTAAKWGPGKALQLERESPDEVMSGVDGLAWLPTGPEVLADILAWCGFPHSRLSFHRPTAQGWSRIELFAARDAAVFSHFDASGREAKALPPPAEPTFASRLAAKLGRKRRRPGANAVVVPRGKLDMLRSPECRGWIAEHCGAGVDGYRNDEGDFVVTFASREDAARFRQRWLS